MFKVLNFRKYKKSSNPEKLREYNRESKRRQAARKKERKQQEKESPEQTQPQQPDNKKQKRVYGIKDLINEPESSNTKIDELAAKVPVIPAYEFTNAQIASIKRSKDFLSQIPPRKTASTDHDHDHDNDAGLESCVDFFKYFFQEASPVGTCATLSYAQAIPILSLFRSLFIRDSGITKDTYRLICKEKYPRDKTGRKRKRQEMETERETATTGENSKLADGTTNQETEYRPCKVGLCLKFDFHRRTILFKKYGSDKHTHKLSPKLFEKSSDHSDSHPNPAQAPVQDTHSESNKVSTKDNSNSTNEVLQKIEKINQQLKEAQHIFLAPTPDPEMVRKTAATYSQGADECTRLYKLLLQKKLPEETERSQKKIKENSELEKDH
ncbi:unnamed protein product [Ambrosiozyma monospora]|uniref:Unnamed protein product n=1 Tax=Ambrosiozyma monospora TaxID=43982 RepID=A0ACB5T020_AMBMO|nr:unnamed protein product [Ambrosiozyma monospora]